MKDQKTTKCPDVEPDAPLALTAEQLTQVAGGSSVRGGVCCQTCASVGRPAFSALAAAIG
ncbi:MAG TPA: hypothetical protein VIY55_13475 [Acetobacteraceae bacterium]|jgi:hypothetical protein